MTEKYFLHRIQRENGNFVKGIEIHDTLDSAVLSYWGRVKLGYNASQAIDFVSVKITDISGNVVSGYDMTWIREGADLGGVYFMHHVMLNGENYIKDIDVCANLNTAIVAYASAMEYGYNNTKHTEISYVSCEITDIGGIVMKPYKACWTKAEPEPEPEPEQ